MSQFSTGRAHPGHDGDAGRPAGIAEIKASAHLLTLDTGLFCLFQLPGSARAGEAAGLPGIRVTPAPRSGERDDDVEIAAFRDDGWIGARDDGALVRVRRGPAQVLVTIYQLPDGSEPPRLQVLRLGAAAAPQPAAPPSSAPTGFLAPHPGQPVAQSIAPAPQPRASVTYAPSQGEAQVGAHVQGRGDVVAPLGQWIGDRDSGRWIEGLVIAPNGPVAPADIEYQVLLGRDWLSPWAEGGQFCGSRGMALPILGLRARLRGPAAERLDCVYAATFVDGAACGPVRNGEPCESASLAPLEAFQLLLRPRAIAQTLALAPASEPAARPAKPGRRTPGRRPAR